METKSCRKYNSVFRKNIKQKITKVLNKNDFIFIYNIINVELKTKLSVNRNGIYFNLNLLSDTCIEKLNNFLDEKICNGDSIIEEKIKYNPYLKDVATDSTYMTEYKLSNQEKSLIKKFHQI